MSKECLLGRIGTTVTNVGLIGLISGGLLIGIPNNYQSSVNNEQQRSYVRPNQNLKHESKNNYLGYTIVLSSTGVLLTGMCMKGLVRYRV